MKRIIILGCSIIIASCALVSCNGGEANAINNPTVEEMAKLEKSWGMEPRKAQPRSMPMPVDNSPLAGRIPASAPETAPLPNSPSAAPAPAGAPDAGAAAPVIPPSLR